MIIQKILIGLAFLFLVVPLVAQNTFHTTENKYYSRDLYEQALKGNAMAQNDLGSCYDRASGVEQDRNEAFKWFQKSAEQGNMLGEYNLGWYYFKGIGCTKNYEQAVIWFQKSAEKGFVYAQMNLAACYKNGYGID